MPKRHHAMLHAHIPVLVNVFVHSGSTVATGRLADWRPAVFLRKMAGFRFIIPPALIKDDWSAHAASLTMPCGVNGIASLVHLLVVFSISRLCGG